MAALVSVHHCNGTDERMRSSYAILPLRRSRQTEDCSVDSFLRYGSRLPFVAQGSFEGAFRSVTLSRSEHRLISCALVNVLLVNVTMPSTSGSYTIGDKTMDWELADQPLDDDTHKSVQLTQLAPGKWIVLSTREGTAPMTLAEGMQAGAYIASQL
jgi:hypothetical protein